MSTRGRSVSTRGRRRLSWDLGQRTAALPVPQERPVVHTTSRNNHGQQAMDQKGVTCWQRQVRASQSGGDAMDEKEAT